jgi:hypothetical protein
LCPNCSRNGFSHRASDRARVARPQKQKRGHTSLNVFQVFQNETCGAALVVTIFLKNFEKLSKEPEPRFNFEVERRSTRIDLSAQWSTVLGDAKPAGDDRRGLPSVAMLE